MRPNLSSIEAEDISARLVDWYWKFGVQRSADQALGTGTWLEQVYRIGSIATAIRGAKDQGNYCQAIWGPSQSGKSTLLSRYLDQAAGNFVSALQWSPSEPVLFVGHENAPANFVALNPYQGRADASGCVSRFVLKQTVPDVTHPVGLRLASDQQILQALAIGYLTECDTRNEKNEELFLDEEEFSALLESCRKGSSGSPSREAYERLYQLAAVLDDLIFGGWPRFRNLARPWDSLRARLLESPALLANPQAVSNFANHILWDNQIALTNLYSKLCKHKEKIEKLTGGLPIYCSYRAAAIFLNIAAYRQLMQTGAGRDTVLKLRSQVQAERFNIGAEGDGLLFESQEEFGLWQGLVWELIIPVNENILAATSPVALDFLKGADLLDFPGVALAYEGGVKPRADLVSQQNLLAEVLKRGKTASIVATRSRQLEIMGFSVLNRFQEPPAQPDQLLTGIKAWAKHLGFAEQSQGLPLNLILTFGAKPINEQIFQLRMQRDAIDFSGVFSWLEKLGELADPDRVQFFATTYSHLPQGKIEGTPEEIKRASTTIIESKIFKHWFRNPETFNRMVEGGVSGDGGTDYLLRKLTEQGRRSTLTALLADRESTVLEALGDLLERALPSDPLEARAQELEKWKRGIDNAIARHREAYPYQDAAHKISRDLRRLFDVESEILEPIPQQTAAQDTQDFLSKQIRRWHENRISQQLDWSGLGLDDKSIANRTLGYLCDYAIRYGGISLWLRENFGHLLNRRDAAQARRFLAIKISDSLCVGPNGKLPHRQFSPQSSSDSDVNSDFIDIRLRGYADNELREAEDHRDVESPHYRGFIEPFLLHLENVKKTTTKARPDQPGDGELRKLKGSLE